MGSYKHEMQIKISEGIIFKEKAKILE